ncbi:glycosyltransferase [Actinoplanes subtropicus]|uniref:glycosyltransferase n=1 Tax=Actinoplanes subtropicus TaxID=543632 RepID=UPI0007C587C1|nr:glycosyltransferase family 2 protein [Actinoplanes subtropicus]
MAKSPRVYLLILTVWIAVLIPAVPAMAHVVSAAVRTHWYLGALTIASALFVTYFWLNGTKDIVYTLYFHLVQRPRLAEVPRRAATEAAPKVVLLYCTCDDFSGESLLRSMAQKYDNYEVVILDDSNKPESRAEVDEFAARYGVPVVRRPDRAGFKAGNLNNYLRTADYDYFVILDSDEIIPSGYIDRSLDYFAHYDNAGIVQANHSATRNRNNFMRTFAIGVDSHWIAYQTVKDRHGFLSLLGHGAMVSRECYLAAGGFPSVVAEDLCFSIAARDAGYYTVFAPDIRCEEEFPVSYFAFKKRHSKWTQGNMEFIKRYTATILNSRMTWFEKLDIFLFTYSLPLTALFSLYVVIHVVALPALGYTVTYPMWMLIPTVAFLIAPLLNDIIFHFARMPKRRLVAYLLNSIVLYGSMFFVSLRSSVTSAFGKSVFVVTPKTHGKVSVREALHSTRGEIGFGIVLAAISWFLTHSVLPVLLIVAPALLCAFLARKHNEDSPEPAAAELPAAVVPPARSAAEERHQLAALASEEEAEPWRERIPTLAGS